ncbi:MAG: polyphosphate--glucose phosphotransferase [Verrucomicrobiota bacterium]
MTKADKPSLQKSAVSKNNWDEPHLILGVDIGGTSIKAAVVDTLQGRLTTDVARVKTPQPATPKSVVAAIGELTKGFKWTGPVGVGFPGLIKQGIVRRAPNLDPSWVRHEIVDYMRRVLGVSFVAVGNDADAAGLAEARFGAGRGVRGTVVLVTLGTGIGSAVLHDGSLLPDTELGHLEINGQDAEKLASSVARERNKWTWEEWGKHVDRYLSTLEYMLAPDLFIIGGGVSADPESFFLYLENAECKIVPATMGNDAGIVGAALFAQPGVKIMMRKQKRTGA